MGFCVATCTVQYVEVASLDGSQNVVERSTGGHRECTSTKVTRAPHHTFSSQILAGMTKQCRSVPGRLSVSDYCHSLFAQQLSHFEPNAFVRVCGQEITHCLVKPPSVGLTLLINYSYSTTTPLPVLSLY